MELSEVKKFIRRYGVKEWVESGINVIQKGDKLIDKAHSFSRLDYYSKKFSVEFCTFEKIIYPCGEIELKNGDIIYYNIHK